MSNFNKCSRCKRFDRYYTMDIKRFNQTAVGWCCDKRDIVSAQSKCDNFIRKPTVKKLRSSIKVCLNNLLTDISVIRNIIEEEQRENQEL